MAYPDLKGAIVHSDRGSQYTSQIYSDTIAKKCYNEVSDVPNLYRWRDAVLMTGWN